MAALDLTLMSVPARKGERVAWADIAKAFSMILLVAYTLHGDGIYLNQMLTFVRMPLFFFVSGLFGYRVVTATSFRTLMRDKVTNFVYLYVLWEVILYLVIRVVSHHVQGFPPLEGLRMLSLLWDPMFNIWFLYALALAFLIALVPAHRTRLGGAGRRARGLHVQRRRRPLGPPFPSSSGWRGSFPISGSG